MTRLQEASLWRAHSLAIVGAAICIAALAAAWTLALVGIDSDRKSVLAELERNNGNLARVLEEQTRRTIKSVDQIVLFVRSAYMEHGEHLKLQDLMAAGNIELSSRNGDPTSAIGQIRVLDAAGDPLLLADSAKKINVADRAYFAVHRDLARGDRVYVSSPVVSRATGKPSIQVSRRIVNSQGEFAGVVTASIDLAYFTSIFELARLGPKDVISLVALEGETIARRVGPVFSSGEDLRGSLLFARQHQAANGSYIGAGALDGVTKHFSYRTVAELGLLVTVGSAMEDAMAPAVVRKHIYLVTAGIATALLLVVLALLASAARRQNQLEERVRLRTVEVDLARSDAELANQAKSDFLATISHELRTPMSGLLGLLELLGLDKLKKEQHETLAVARESGNALLRIIDDLLDFSKIEANRLELNPTAASVAELVGRSCRLHSQIASSKGLTLTSNVDPQISPLLSFDTLRLGQVLNNFINNAIKFTERGGVDVRVDLAGRTPGSEELRFTVLDTGIGIAPDQLGRLFQPFVQAGRDTSTRFGGTGLGLVISRRLAHLMGGAVDIQSEPDRGTTLTLTVAFAVCTGELVAVDTDRQVFDTMLAGRRSVPALQEAERDGTLLLLVDDHPTNRMLMLRQVASLGYAAETADDGQQALSLWMSGRFAAMITDCNMPRMNGYDLTAAIRSAEEQTGARRSPIIGCTANATREAAEQCLSAGMDDWLVKPAGLAEMSRKLDLWVPLARFERMGTVLAPPHSPRPHASAPVEADLIDLVLLGEISGGNPKIQQQILSDFHRVNEQDAVSLRQAVLENDFTRLMQLAHRIKGANLMLGAARMAAACERLESAGAAGQSGELQAAMAVFEAELLRLNQSFGKLSAAQ